MNRQIPDIFQKMLLIVSANNCENGGNYHTPPHIPNTFRNIKRFSQEYPGMAIKPDFSRFKDMELRYHIVDAFTDRPLRRDAEKEFTIRYFTPKAEVELCGHATYVGGTAAVVAEGKLLTE